MLSRKYLSDYIVVSDRDAKGRQHLRREYVGKRFRFRAAGEELARLKRSVAALAFACVPVCLIPLLLNVPIIRRGAVMFPLAMTVLPVGGLCVCAVRALLGRDGFTREERDGIAGRIAPWSFLLLVLTGASLIAQLVYYFSGAAAAADVPVTVCTLLLAVLGGFLFSRRRAFEMEEQTADQPVSHSESCE